MLVVCAMVSAIRAGVKGDVIRLKNAGLFRQATILTNIGEVA